MFSFVYCPSHLGIHHKNEDGTVWCTTNDHVVGDKSRITGLVIKAIKRRLPVYDIAFLREVIEVDDEAVVWKRAHNDNPPYTCSRKTWEKWAKGSWRCNREGVAHRNPEWK